MGNIKGGVKLIINNFSLHLNYQFNVEKKYLITKLRSLRRINKKMHILQKYPYKNIHCSELEMDFINRQSYTTHKNLIW